jgi:dihydroorotate dehydrogenase electron transfer subunit
MEKPVLHAPMDTSAIVLANERLADGVSLLTLHAPEIASAARPGQFVNIACDRFLRRPLGIAGVETQSGSIRIGIQVKGPGTRDIASSQPGSHLSLLGPLGHGFDLDGVENLVVVAGGTGLFPALFLLDHARGIGIKSMSYCGYRSLDTAFLMDLVKDFSDSACFASDNGEFGFHGTCVQALDNASYPEGPACRIGDRRLAAGSTLMAAVGPMPMMRAAALQAERLGIACQVSMEERMACGFGVCLVCACKTHSDDPAIPYHYSRCCAEGPVFRAEDVVWG